MPAVSVGTSTTEIVPADPDNHRRVFVRNATATQVVHLAVGEAAATTSGYPLPTASPVVELNLPPGQALNGITVVAAQDVRYIAV